MSFVLQIRDLEKRYGTDVLFDGASVTIAPGDRVGVVGRNGAGKSTLCRIVTGEEEADGGSVRVAPGARLGYVEQGTPFGEEETVRAWLERVSGREPWVCAKAAGRFGIAGDTLEAAVARLPGGYQTRVRLAAMVVVEPDFLVLDEPTNYLDLRTLLFLERFLAGFSGGYLVVSHDREFLRRTCTSTLEVEGGSLRLFPGDVDAWRAAKAEEHERRLREQRNVEAKRKDLQDFVDRNRVRAATASRAQSRLKQLEKLETVEVDAPAETATIRLPRIDARPGTALSCEDLAVGYPGREVASGIRFDLERGRHVAVLGDNGEGKTTFLRTVAGQVRPRGGAYRWGHHEEVALYAQHVYAAIPGGLGVLEWLRSCARPEASWEDVLAMAGGFLFRDDDLSKTVDVLSGGERARLCLAGLLLQGKPVLLLDEPTNHLDFETAEALGDALADYPGTILFVSHDREFTRRLATDVLEVGGGRIVLWPAGYDAWVDRAERETDRATGGGDGASPDRGGGPGRGTGPGAAEYERRKALRSRRQKLARETEAAEERVASLDAEREAIHRWFLEHPTEPSEDRERRLAELGGLIAEEERRWERLQEELESLEDPAGDG